MGRDDVGVACSISRNGVPMGFCRCDEGFRLTGLELPDTVKLALERVVEGSVRYCVDGEPIVGGVVVDGQRWTFQLEDGGGPWFGVGHEGIARGYQRCWRDRHDAEWVAQSLTRAESCHRAWVAERATWAAARMCCTTDPQFVPDRGPWHPSQG